MNVVSFPSIRKLSDVIKDVPYIFKGDVPTELTFLGTIKLHGTHADIVLHSDGNIVIQSRHRILTIYSDNSGCAHFFENRRERLRLLFDSINTGFDETEFPIVIAGEFCGKGIQKRLVV